MGTVDPYPDHDPNDTRILCMKASAVNPEKVCQRVKDHLGYCSYSRLPGQPVNQPPGIHGH